MPERCLFPGCNYSYKNFVKFNLTKHSLHRVPPEHKKLVCELLNIEVSDIRPVFLCSAHYRENSLVIGRNKRLCIRKDVPYEELLIVPGSTTNGAQTERARPYVSKRFKKQKGTFLSKKVSRYVAKRLKPGQPRPGAKMRRQAMQKVQRNLQDAQELSDNENEIMDLDRHFMSPNSRLNIRVTPAKNSPSNILLDKQRKEIEHSKSHTNKVETRGIEGERINQEKLGKTSSLANHSIDVRDNEIANLKRQIQRTISEIKDLYNTRQSLEQDLKVYRKLMQLESRSSNTNALIESNPLNNVQLTPTKRTSSTSSVEIMEDCEAVCVTKQYASPNKSTDCPGSLDQLKKWLKTSQKF